MQCKQLEVVLEQEGLGPLPTEARDHLAECTACQDFLADLTAIVDTAKQLPVEADPPERIWISLRVQLEAEHLVKQPRAPSYQIPWWQNFSLWFEPRSLAAVGVGLLLLIASIFLTHKPAEDKIAKQPAPEFRQDFPPAAPRDVLTASTTALREAERDLPNVQYAGNAMVDASLRQNLRTVNEFIAECEQHLKEYPQDELARDYLYGAYQQKAELLAAMMDSGRSEH
jgi:hypothetical protein